MANSPQSILSMIKAKEVKFVDLRFTDPRGKWQHVTFDLSMVDDDFLTNGTMFDGSSIAGPRLRLRPWCTTITSWTTSCLELNLRTEANP